MTHDWHSLFFAFFHIDEFLMQWVTQYGNYLYGILFVIIFSETGLVILPFLPGDSLLFATGSLTANPNFHFSYFTCLWLLTLAAMLGNQVNYWIGRYFGNTLSLAKKSWLFNPAYLEDAHRFYEKHGGKTLIIARFMPIIRTFVPFVAGMSRMEHRRFTLFNLLSALLWVGSLLSLGYLFGNLPLIKHNFTTAIYFIIIVSLLPGIFAWWKKA